jgi:IclR family transcriptional regulator, mhp operon transcriptional activator
MLWLKTAFSIEVFATRYLADLQETAAEIVNALRKRAKR